MFAALALASAACYGAADFIGGMAAPRRHDSGRRGLAGGRHDLVALMLPLLDAPIPGRLDLMWSGAAGIAAASGWRCCIAPRRGRHVADRTGHGSLWVRGAGGHRRGAARRAAGGQASLGIAPRARRGRAISQADARTTAAPAAGRYEASPPGTRPRARVGRVHRPLLCRAGPDERRGGALATIDRRTCSVGFFGVLALASGRSLRLPRPIAATAMAGAAWTCSRPLYLLRRGKGR